MKETRGSKGRARKREKQVSSAEEKAGVRRALRAHLLARLGHVIIVLVDGLGLLHFFHHGILFARGLIQNRVFKKRQLLNFTRFSLAAGAPVDPLSPAPWTQNRMYHLPTRH